MVKGQPNDQLINNLGPESHLLPDMEREFYRHFKFDDSKVLSFYETKDTPSVEVTVHLPKSKQCSYSPASKWTLETNGLANSCGIPQLGDTHCT
jgi:hypothetical protein